MKQRVGYFDIAKGIGIILVVIAHIEYMPLELRQYIVTFHMPAFFVISGMLMNLTNEKTREIKPILVHKFNRILLPYFIFSLIYPITYYLRYLIVGAGYSTEHFFQDLLVGVSLAGVSVLWFLPALFFSELIILVLIRHMNKTYLLIVYVLFLAGLWFLPLAFPALALFLWRVIICNILVLIGYLLFPVVSKVSDKPAFLLPVSVVLFTVLYFTGLKNGIVDLHYIITGNILLYYLNATMGSVALILLSVFIEAKIKGISPVLQFFGRHSLFIMLTHIDFMILYFGEKLAFAFSDATPRGKEFVFNLTATVSTLLIETVLIIIWEKIKNCGILIIGDKIKSKE